MQRRAQAAAYAARIHDQQQAGETHEYRDG
jgi:hypothetical protein